MCGEIWGTPKHSNNNNNNNKYNSRSSKRKKRSSRRKKKINKNDEKKRKEKKRDWGFLILNKRLRTNERTVFLSLIAPIFFSFFGDFFLFFRNNIILKERERERERKENNKLRF